jgi:cardiolipin synthase
VRVFEWNGPMLHAKTAVADGSWTRIGSSNSNLASWVSNRELDVTIKDEKLAAEMEAMFETDMQNSTEVVLVRGRSGIMRPDSRNVPRVRRRPLVSASRFVSGAIGFGNTLGASFAQRRILGPAETLVLLGGGCLVLLGGLLALFLPRLVAYPIAIAAFWFAATLLFHAWHLWRSGPAKS